MVTSFITDCHFLANECLLPYKRMSTFFITNYHFLTHE